MHPHEKPSFKYAVKVSKEVGHLTSHRKTRKVPARKANNVIIATWNLTNFGVQEREDKHLDLMAEIIRPFDVIAVQELAEDVSHFETLVSRLGTDWRALYTDAAGNNERLGYLYDSSRVQPQRLAAELAMTRTQRQTINFAGSSNVFEEFNRTPFIVEFRSGNFTFDLVNVHLYWSTVQTRIIETKALAKWAKGRVKKEFPPNNDIILIGDFNMPVVKEGDPIYDELVSCGLKVAKHRTMLVGSNLAGDKDYDQLAFFPSQTDTDFIGIGVFDFDTVIFPDLYQRNQEGFYKYVRYYMADHRPLWAEFRR